MKPTDTEIVLAKQFLARKRHTTVEDVQGEEPDDLFKFKIGFFSRLLRHMNWTPGCTGMVHNRRSWRYGRIVRYRLLVSRSFNLCKNYW